MLSVEGSAWLAAENAEIPSVAYCQARKRLPEKLLQRLFSRVAQDLEKKTAAEHLWCGPDGATSAPKPIWRKNLTKLW